MRGLGLFRGMRKPGGSVGAPPPYATTAVRFPTGALFTRNASGFTGGNVGDFSFGGWFRKDALLQQYLTFFAMNTAPGTYTPGSYFWLGHDSTAGGGNRGVSLDTGAGAHSLTLLPANGTWFHLALSKAGPVITVWQDGVQVSWDAGQPDPTVFDCGRASFASINHLYLCEEDGFGGLGFNGAIRAPYVKDSAMTAGEHATARVKSSPIPVGIGSWPFQNAGNYSDANGGQSFVKAWGTLGADTTGPAGITGP